MKIVFIRPPFSNDLDTNTEIPLNLIMLSTFLKLEGFETQIVDFELLCKRDLDLKKDFFGQFEKYLNLDHDDILGITCLNVNYPITIEMCKRIKSSERKNPIILGGPQATLTAEKTLNTYSFVDYIIKGEGEFSLSDLVKNITRKVGAKKIEDIGSLVYRKNQKICVNPDLPLISNLDELPFPDYSFINFTDYYPDQSIESRFPIYAGSGCPFACSFCCTSIIWKRKYRLKSSQRLIQEMQLANKSFGVSYFSLEHDNLLFKIDFLEEMIPVMQEKKFRWIASCRLDQINERLLALASQAGCRSLFVGIESASEKTQKEIGKNIQNLDMIEKIKLCTRFGIDLSFSFIVGFPEENEEDIFKTLNLAMEAKLAGCRFVELNTFEPMAGTCYTSYDLIRKDSAYPDFIALGAYQQLTIDKNWNNVKEIFSNMSYIPSQNFSYPLLKSAISSAQQLLAVYPLSLNFFLKVKQSLVLMEFANFLSFLETSSHELSEREKSLGNLCREGLVALTQDETNYLKALLLYEDFRSSKIKEKTLQIPLAADISLYVKEKIYRGITKGSGNLCLERNGDKITVKRILEES